MSALTSSRNLARHLCFEQLEDRRVLATFTVTSLGDAPVTFPGAAPGTLRQAIYDANHTAEPDVIQFAANLSGTVNLSVVDDTSLGASALVVSSTITIRGNANGITIGRDEAAVEMRPFYVTSSGILMLDSISVAGGVAQGTNGVDPSDVGGEARGGAIYNEGSVEIVASTFYANEAIGGNGGEMGNGGSGRGGAIYSDDATLTITDSTFSGNSVQSGTGVQAISSFGGAIYTKNGTLTVHNSTITNGTATTGRGIYMLAVDGTATADIQSNIIGQSDFSISIRDFLTAPDTNGQFVITGADNLIRSQGDYQFITVSTDDPMLGPLANNGGPTMTHALLTGSPAIDFGNNAQGLATDQRGVSYSRVVGVAADIGAFEAQTAVGPALLGDYNQNHTVDAADYVLWRKTLGSDVSQYAGADGNGNASVDSGDYGIWRSHFGSTGTAGTATLLSADAIATPAFSEVIKPLSFTLPDAVATSVASDSKPPRSRPVVPSKTSSQINLALLELIHSDALPSRHPAQNSVDPRAVNPQLDSERKTPVLDALWAAWPEVNQRSI